MYSCHVHTCIYTVSYYNGVGLDIVPAENLLQLHTVKHTRNLHFILQEQIEQSQAEQ